MSGIVPYIMKTSRPAGKGRRKRWFTMAQQLRPHAARKANRIEARLTDEQKELIQHAAELLGLSVSDFLITSAQRAAESVIREHNVITLTAQDSRAFAEAILNPRKPNEALRDAFARHDRQLVRGDQAHGE
jgi:uncharacterized protein (DUF1778 family)